MTSHYFGPLRVLSIVKNFNSSLCKFITKPWPLFLTSFTDDPYLVIDSVVISEHRSLLSGSSWVATIVRSNPIADEILDDRFYTDIRQNFFWTFDDQFVSKCRLRLHQSRVRSCETVRFSKCTIGGKELAFNNR